MTTDQNVKVSKILTGEASSFGLLGDCDTTIPFNLAALYIYSFVHLFSHIHCSLFKKNQSADKNKYKSDITGVQNIIYSTYNTNMCMHAQLPSHCYDSC